MSNMNFNGGRGERKENKATSASEHKFGGSHKANPGGKRGDAPVKGSHGGSMKGCATDSDEDGY
jgi:hypothetical protein